MKNKSLLLTFGILIIALNSVAQVTGTFPDQRDGKTYQTVIIGSQTWMSENLKYNPDDNIILWQEHVSWCYHDSSSNCTKYGRLYSFETAKNACPDGWRLPSSSDWDILIKYLGKDAGSKLKSNSTWHSIHDPSTNNTSGFQAFAGGFRDNDGSFHNLGIAGYWWTNDVYKIVNLVGGKYVTTSKGIGYSIDYKYSSVEKQYNFMSACYSVRCLKEK